MSSVGVLGMGSPHAAPTTQSREDLEDLGALAVQVEGVSVKGVG